MKSIKSIEALRKVALQKGASATVGGTKINSTGDKVVAVQFPKPEPEPTPGPINLHPVQIKSEPDLAAIVQASADAMASSVNSMAKDNALVMAEVAKVMEKLALQQAPVIQETIQESPAKAWKLKVNRDTRGFMDTVDITRVG